MSEQQQLLALVAAGVCTQAGDTDFAAHVAVALKLNGAQPDPALVVPVPVPEEGAQPILAAALDEAVLPKALSGSDRLGALLAPALLALQQQLPPATAGAEVHVHLLLPTAVATRGTVLLAELRKRALGAWPLLAGAEWSCGTSAVGALRQAQGSERGLFMLIGLDSWVGVEKCLQLARAGRAMTVGARQGLVPGEAAAVVVLARDETPLPARAWLRGWAEADEPAAGQAEHKRLSGLQRACREALQRAQLGSEAIGEVWHGLGAELAGELEWYQLRQALWPGRPLQGAPLQQRPAQAFGEVGAASLPLMLALAAAGFAQAARYHRYGFPAPAPALICDTPQTAQRSAVCLTPA